MTYLGYRTFNDRPDNLLPAHIKYAADIHINGYTSWDMGDYVKWEVPESPRTPNPYQSQINGWLREQGVSGGEIVLLYQNQPKYQQAQP